MILVIGGTKDSRLIVNGLMENQRKVLVTTTTDYGASLLPNHPFLLKKVGRFTQKDFVALVHEHSIDLIIDATHPYAEAVSRNIITVSDHLKIKLLRYERPREKNEYAQYFDTYEEMINILKKKEGNILLTIGSKAIDSWSKSLAPHRLKIRVLPMASVLKKCEALGFTPKQIIAVQGPFSVAFNQMLMKDYQIKYLITKDTGTMGGFHNKVKSACDANVQVYVKKRPRLAYKNEFDDLDQMIKEIENIYE